jgi:predicted outer membrane protein
MSGQRTKTRARGLPSPVRRCGAIARAHAMHCCSPMLNKSERFAVVVMGALLFGTAACGDDNNDNLGGNVDPIAEGQARGEMLATMAAEDLSVQNEMVAMSIAGDIMITIDQGEIMQAQLALDNVVFDPAVISFAEQMIDEHTAHTQMVQDLLARFGLTRLDNRISAALRSETEASLVDIANSDNPDRTYMEFQVMMHQEALVLLGSLDDQVDTAEMDALIRTTEDQIAAHRDTAINVLQLR